MEVHKVALVKVDLASLPMYTQNPLIHCQVVYLGKGQEAKVAGSCSEVRAHDSGHLDSHY